MPFRSARLGPIMMLVIFALETSNNSVDRSACVACLNVLHIFSSNGVASIDYMTQPDMATSGDDYVAKSGILTFDDGVKIQQVVIPLVRNTEMQHREQLKIIIDNPVDAGLHLHRMQWQSLC